MVSDLYTEGKFNNSMKSFLTLIKGKPGWLKKTLLIDKELEFRNSNRGQENYELPFQMRQGPNQKLSDWNLPNQVAKEYSETYFLEKLSTMLDLVNHEGKRYGFGPISDLPIETFDMVVVAPHQSESLAEVHFLPKIYNEPYNPPY